MKALFSVSPVVLFTVFLMLALPVSAEEKNEAGFKVWLQSLKQEALEKGYRIDTFPAKWIERKKGQSRFRILKWALNYLYWYFYAFKIKIFKNEKK